GVGLLLEELNERMPAGILLGGAFVAADDLEAPGHRLGAAAMCADIERSADDDDGFDASALERVAKTLGGLFQITGNQRRNSWDATIEQDDGKIFGEMIGECLFGAEK